MATNIGAELMKEISGNGYVKWKGLFALLIPLLGSLLLFSYSSSERNISKETFDQFEKRFEKSQTRIERSIERLTEELFKRMKYQTRG